MQLTVVNNEVKAILDCGVQCNALSLYLCASYTYKEAYGNIIADHDYDTLCQVLIKYKDRPEIKNHIHYDLVNFEALKASTGWYDIQYTNQIKDAAIRLLEITSNQSRKEWFTPGKYSFESG